jgi:Putative peptidoglycan binding domain/PGAP1-like protein
MAPLLSPRFRDDPVLQAVARGLVRLGRPSDRGSPPVRSSGPAVVAVQRALLDLGYKLPRRGPDGRYGQETYAAVLSYKRARNILTDQGYLDGIVGPKTIASLDAAFPPPAPPVPPAPAPPVVTTGPVPIVFVPGLMGSRMCTKDSSGSPGAVWDPDNRTAMLRLLGQAMLSGNVWETLGIDRRPLADFPSTFSGPGPSPGGALSPSRIAQIRTHRCWERVSFSFYGEFLLAAEQRFNTPPFPVSCPVFAFGYDWRQSNEFNGRRLVEYVRSHVLQVTPGARSVVLVTHSMGGLVARAALKDPGFVKQVCGVVHAMQPSTGAVVTYRRCLTGVRLRNDEVSLNSASTAVGASASEAVLAIILGTNPLAFTTNILTIPGALELLPNRVYKRPWLLSQRRPPLTPTDITPADPYTLYSSSTPLGLLRSEVVKFYGQRRPVITRGALAGRIAAAALFHDSIRTTFHPNTVVVFGNGVPTDTATLVNIGGSSPVTAIKSPEGDGTVPAHSGSCPGAGPTVTRVPVTGVEHAACFNDPGFRQVVLTQVDRVLAASCGLPTVRMAEAMRDDLDLLPSY